MKIPKAEGRDKAKTVFVRSPGDTAAAEKARRAAAAKKDATSPVPSNPPPPFWRTSASHGADHIHPALETPKSP